jgi:DNA-binding transcriptional regulator GbsR (MarR family)
MSRPSPVIEKFIVHWGEMGSRWGVSRIVAQTHALLYVTPEPLHAEEIAETLSAARSSVSTALRDLQGWGLIRVVHLLGDRRDYFEAVGDAWEMLRVITRERKRREIDPTLRVLEECLEEARGEVDADVRDRLQQLHDVFLAIDDWYEQVASLPTAALRRLVKIGGGVRRLLKLERSSKPRGSG